MAIFLNKKSYSPFSASIKSRSGFTMLEIVVSLSIFTTVIILLGSMYSLSQKSYNKGSNRAEITQNARVCLDRVSRELRQSASIAVALPAPGNGAANEVFFQDGHDISQITYIKYYLNGRDLMRKKTAYYFDSAPGEYVPWNSFDEFGDSPEEYVFEDRVVGEYFDELEFWGLDGLINIAVELSKGEEDIKINTNIYSRNF